MAGGKPKPAASCQDSVAPCENLSQVQRKASLKPHQINMSYLAVYLNSQVVRIHGQSIQFINTRIFEEQAPKCCKLQHFAAFRAEHRVNTRRLSSGKHAHTQLSYTIDPLMCCADQRPTQRRCEPFNMNTMDSWDTSKENLA